VWSDLGTWRTGSIAVAPGSSIQPMAVAQSAAAVSNGLCRGGATCRVHFCLLKYQNLDISYKEALVPG